MVYHLAPAENLDSNYKATILAEENKCASIYLLQRILNKSLQNRYDYIRMLL